MRILYTLKVAEGFGLTVILFQTLIQKISIAHHTRKGGFRYGTRTRPAQSIYNDSNSVDDSVETTDDIRLEYSDVSNFIR